MEYRFLGKTGLRVSELCLGAMTFGREADEATSFQMMDTFIEAGGNFIDTANVYSSGTSEEILGKWLKGKNRRDVVVATKVRFGMGDGPNDIGLSRKHIMDSVEDSLRRLGTDYIDLYQVHNFDFQTPLRETLTTLDLLVKQGKVRYIGASNYKGYQLQKAIDISKEMNLEPFTCLQPLYNLLDRAVEWELMEVCQNEGLGVIPWSPLRGGWLTGKYTRAMEGNIPENMRLKLATEFGWSESWENYGNNRTWDIIDELVAVATEVDKSIPQTALNWVKDRPGVTAPIIGARNMQQLTDNMGSVGWSLSADQRQRLDDISNMPGPYYSVIEDMMTRR
ncbi:MAG: aldo/keto reductase [Anaerolineae bacterium]|nr:aldo/keto reductase [Anaerolineae bacterium]